MARGRPSRGQEKGGDGKSSSPAPARRRRTPSPRPVGPGAGRRSARQEKAGTVTKAVQQSRGSRFLSEVVAELRKVSWPTRAVLLQSTGVVLLVVAVVSAYLAALDEVFGRLVDALF
jgi:preprotein translocase subunit SecE